MATRHGIAGHRAFVLMVLGRLKVLLNPILKPVLNALFFHAYSPPCRVVRIIPERMAGGERGVNAAKFQTEALPKTVFALGVVVGAFVPLLFLALG
jgi:hypothetical protein